MAVSDGVEDDLSCVIRVPRREVVTIYNPMVHAGLSEQAKAALDHAWFHPDAPPVILGAGRLTQQKDFPTLLRAFARVRQQRRVRLIILGEGPLWSDLENIVRTLGIATDVALPDVIRTKVGPQVWDEYFKFTIVRSPWALFMSFYYRLHVWMPLDSARWREYPQDSLRTQWNIRLGLLRGIHRLATGEPVNARSNARIPCLDARSVLVCTTK